MGLAIKFAAVLRKYGSIWSGPADFLQARPNRAFCTSETDTEVKLKSFKFTLDNLWGWLGVLTEYLFLH